MTQGRLAVYDNEYLRKAKAKQAFYNNRGEEEAAAEALKICCSCEQQFQDGAMMYICRSKFGPRRRHLHCAVNKNCATGEELEEAVADFVKVRLLDKVAKDMQEEIPRAIVQGFTAEVVMESPVYRRKIIA